MFYAPSGEPRAAPGFDAVIGNPPWEMLRQDDGTRGGGGAGAAVATFAAPVCIPSCDRGHLNLYQAFIDRALALARPGGRVGLVVPWGLASDDGASALRRAPARRRRLDTTGRVSTMRPGSLPDPSRDALRRRSRPRPVDQRAEIRSAIRREDERRTRPAAGVRRRDGHPAYPDSDRRGAAIELVGGPLRRFPDVREAGACALVDAISCSRFPRLATWTGWHVALRSRTERHRSPRRRSAAHGLPVIEGKHVSPFRSPSH